MRYLSNLLALGILFTLLLSSCGSSNDCEEASLNSTFSDATQKITNALLNIDPNNPNTCDDFKDALDDYIDELEDLQGCADDVGQGTEWRDAINDAKDQLNNFSC